MLFQRFDRLLFLARGGRTVYFGPIGESSKTLTKYFEAKGASPCPVDANPAEWMLEVIGAAPGTFSDIDWPQAWRESDEIKAVHAELEQMKHERSQLAPATASKDDKASYREFAAPFGVQLWEVQKRVFAQYWRTPSYIYSKLMLVTISALFIGFSFFMATNSQQGLQNQMFSIFMLFTIFGQLVQQIMPLFVTQRSLYEVRERPSKAYSWKAFIISNIFVEIPWASLCAVIVFVCWYYPIGLYRNAEPDAVHERGFLMFLLVWTFLLFTSTFAHMAIAGIETAETGGNIGNLAFSLTLVFCGVLATKDALPGFWVFMYWLSPFHYLVEGMLATAVADSSVVCAANELLRFSPPAGQTCGQYMAAYMSYAGGYLQDAANTSECSFCQIDNTNDYIAAVDIYYRHAWRDFGIMWVYIIFNVVAAVGIYWLARVPKNKGKSKKKAPTTAPPATQEGEKTV